MALTNILYSYLMYLVHPLKGHAVLNDEVSEEESHIKKISLYEALGTSWAFVVISGLMRILMINFVIIVFFRLTESQDGLVAQFLQADTSGFYFIVLSTVLDVIFFPLLTLIIVHFWEFILKFFGRLMGIEGDLARKARDIMTVSLSSHVLMVIPILGEMAQKLASLVLMFVGIRKQFGAGFALSACILMTPFLLFLGFFSIIMLFVLSSLL